jgi:predicted MFS family arabinose efflux permease
VALGIAMAAGVFLFGAYRPALWLSGLLFAMLVLLAGGRTIAGSAFGLDAAPEHKVALMSVRAAATQFGYLVGAGLGGLALAAGGYSLLGVVLATLFVLAVVPYLPVTSGSLGEGAFPPGSSTRQLRTTAVRVGRSAWARFGACFATRLQ